MFFFVCVLFFLFFFFFWGGGEGEVFVGMFLERFVGVFVLGVVWCCI